MSGGCDRERTDEERTIDDLRHDLASERATNARLAIICEHVQKDLEERTATVERLIREAGAIRADERKRAEAEHKALDDGGRQRDANRIERLEGELARLRVIVDHADKAKAEHAATRDELRRLHDVLSGKRGAP